MNSLPFDHYTPGQFSDIAQTPFAKEFWEYISSEENIEKIVSAAERGDAAITPLMGEISSKFGAKIEDLDFETDRVKILCLNMCKQLLEKRGYMLVACAFMPPGSLFSEAGVFRKVEGQENAGESE